MGKYILAIIALFTSASGFEIIPDTLNLLEKEINKEDSIPFISNNSEDTIKIDSMYVTKYHTNSPYFEAIVGIISGPIQQPLVYSFFHAVEVNGRGLEVRFDRTKINPHTIVYLERGRIDFCVDCPVAKKSAKQIIGDTLSVTMVFVSGNQKDSLTIIGLEKRNSISGVAPSRFSPQKDKIIKSNRNIMGRRLSNPRIERGMSVMFDRQ
jgi:hypothetical protein